MTTAHQIETDLPVWDLSDLYTGRDAPDLIGDLTKVQTDAAAFAADYSGRIAGLDAKALSEAIARYEAIDETLSRLMSYAGLVNAQDMTDEARQRFYADMQVKITDISTGLLFFTLEINRLDEEMVQALTASPDLERYRPWIRDLRVFRPYQLSDDLERLFMEKNVTGAAAWVRLFDETVSGLTVEIDGQTIGLEQALNQLSSTDRTLRARTAEALASAFQPKTKLFAMILNNLIKDKEIEDKWRGIKDPALGRHLANQVEPEVVGALVEAVRERLPRLSYRYYAMKAKWLGLDRLEHYDRNAPLPDQSERQFSWAQAKETVLGAYNRFSPDLATIAQPFFSKPWIDAGIRPGKSPGAFAHPTVPSAHPYLLLNFQGKQRDVMTLAHELGHGVHQILAGSQGHFLSQTPLTLAETASVFGEMLTFRALLDAAPDKRERRALLASKVEDMINTVVRQTAFYNFEHRLHDARRAGELSADRIGEIWMEVQSKSLGPAIHLGAGYETYWCYISHFVHSPFYVYAYAFGDCLVNSLYAVYQDASPGFAERYLDLLRAGGTKRHQELLAPFGLNAADPAFWGKGLSVIEGFIDELAALS
jgi:oligoendopeptidase F